MSLRFFADHCISNSVVQDLRESGHEVLRLKDHISVESPDQVVLSMAQKLDSVLLSLNGDFANKLNYPPAHFKGIIALQVKNHPEIIRQLMTRLIDFLSLHPDPGFYKGKLILVEAHRIRTRQ
jgi:predicted nuclease of predicted toxin-antitoxin system